MNAQGLRKLIFILAAAAVAPAMASQDAAAGLWLSADKAAIIEFKACADAPGALCGTIVWDKDAGTPADACGVMIAKLKTYEDEAWRNGWVHDPRTKKNYKGIVRVKDATLMVRAFIGTELLGETEVMTRASAIPPGCKTKQ
ncbi:DUF2147 domain-containing protein [Massilia sp. CF038]|uniref:DUF2147 domain-containing protein n=1 Tax=Massilia sp. CF038 TaxID=1881045 RepID=UPI000911AB8E|nr:DUF2147 domain-containing protein [Massilia sp. CF038]SHH12191.1 Uncharacterized conserved protein, DUF2147 family [Massilia sp. CF038]